MEKDTKKVQCTVEFIEIVKSEKAIYDLTDPDYKNTENKALAWQRVAMNSYITVDEAKRKWKNLRDSYTKYLKALRIQNTTNSKKYQCWAHAQAMDFLRPFQGPSRSRKSYDNIKIIDANDYDSVPYGEDDPDLSSQLYEKMHSNQNDWKFKTMEISPFEHHIASYNLHETTQYDVRSNSSYGIPEYTDNDIRGIQENQFKRNLLSSQPTNLQETTTVNDFCNNETTQNGLINNKKISLKATDLDSTSLFFLSLAKSVRKMPTKYQAKIKVQCLQIVNEMELSLESGTNQFKSKFSHFRKQNHFSNQRAKMLALKQKQDHQNQQQMQQQPATNLEHFTYEMSPSNIEAMIEITSSDDEISAGNEPN